MRVVGIMRKLDINDGKDLLLNIRKPNKREKRKK